MHFKKKDNLGQGPNGTRFERSDWSLSKSNRLLNPPSPSIISLIKPALSILHQAIKFNCLFLAIFKVLLICELYFQQILALSLNKCFKSDFKLLKSPYHFKRLFQKCEKRGIFLVAHFGLQANGGGGL